MRFFQKHKLEILIFFLAFFVKLITLFLITYREGIGVLSESDALVYIQIAKNILNYRVFSWSQNLPLIPDSFRMPIFPLLLAFIFSLTQKIWLVSIVNNLFSAITCVLVFLVAKKVFNQKIGLLAALVLALEPYMAVYTNFVLIEPIFTLFLVITVYFFVDFLKFNNLKSFYLSIIFLGLFMLTKPFASYSFFIFFSIALIKILTQKIKLFTLKQVSLAGVLLFLILSPWLIRNKLVFNHFSLNSSRDFNLYHWYAPIIYAKENNIPRSDAIHLFYQKTVENFPNTKSEELHNFQFSPYFRKEALKIILSNPLGYAKLHLVGVGYFFLTNGYRSMLMRLFGITEGKIIADPVSVFANQGIEGLISYINSLGAKPIILIIVGFFLVLIINFFFVVNLFFIKKSDSFLSEILLYVLIFYFAFLIGPLASAAYKYPVQPLILLLASAGFFRCFNFWQEKLRKGGI